MHFKKKLKQFQSTVSVAIASDWSTCVRGLRSCRVYIKTF